MFYCRKWASVHPSLHLVNEGSKILCDLLEKSGEIRRGEEGASFYRDLSLSRGGVKSNRVCDLQKNLADTRESFCKFCREAEYE